MFSVGGLVLRETHKDRMLMLEVIGGEGSIGLAAVL